MPGIGIISNPHSKLNRKNPQRHEYLTYIAGEEGHVAVTQTLEDLAKVASDFKEHGIKILAINGGDGTISQTLTAFIKAYDGAPLPKIAILRGGTINVLAENLGIKGSPEQVLYRLIERHSINNLTVTRKISTICIEGQYGFSFGNGTTAGFLELFYKKIKLGPLGSILYWASKSFYLKFLAPNYTKRPSKAIETSAEVDDRTVEKHPAIATFIASIPRMPLGFNLFPKTYENSQTAQLVSYIGSAEKDIYKILFDFFIRTKQAFRY